MSIISADLEMVPTTSATAAAPKILIRGARRRMAQKALRALQSLQNADAREGARAAKIGYTPLYITGYPGSDDAQSLSDVQTRIAAALALKG
ncbi:MAG TPA: hypothetical protein VKT72_07365 [Candidatus Baltobacteraceae bacterium]|nr:hypothetical protein [Candidatus Baltobacteraceae bacterium]